MRHLVKFLIVISFCFIALNGFSAESSKPVATDQASSSPSQTQSENPEPKEVAKTSSDRSSIPPDQSNLGISSNPGAVDISVGSGRAQKFFLEKAGVKDNHGVKFGGLWISDINSLMSGGVKPGAWSLNSLVILDLNIDAQKLLHWKGASFGIDYLQFNGSNTNGEAGSIQGYNGLPGDTPFNRSQLYELWYRQELLDGKLIFRIGKSVPTYDFGNVLRPIPVTDNRSYIPAVSGLIYTPIFINPTMLGVLPGYYNSAYGVVMSIVPVKEWYFTAGVFDGNQARGKQTGINVLPEFNGYYFNAAEVGYNWLMGKDRKPGNIGTGAWYQTGTLQGAPGVSQNGSFGWYLFGSQRLWFRHSDKNNSGLSMYYQFGINNSVVLPITRYVGAGLTGFRLLPKRPLDSLGAGMALSWLNPTQFARGSELMFQAYYQAHIVADLYLQPVFTYIPTPGASPTAHNAVASTLRMMFFF